MTAMPPLFLFQPFYWISILMMAQASSSIWVPGQLNEQPSPPLLEKSGELRELDSFMRCIMSNMSIEWSESPFSRSG